MKCSLEAPHLKQKWLGVGPAGRAWSWAQKGLPRAATARPGPGPRGHVWPVKGCCLGGRQGWPRVGKGPVGGQCGSRPPVRAPRAVWAQVWRGPCESRKPTPRAPLSAPPARPRSRCHLSRKGREWDLSLVPAAWALRTRPLPCPPQPRSHWRGQQAPWARPAPIWGRSTWAGPGQGPANLCLWGGPARFEAGGGWQAGLGFQLAPSQAPTPALGATGPFCCCHR